MLVLCSRTGRGRRLRADAAADAPHSRGGADLASHRRGARKKLDSSRSMSLRARRPCASRALHFRETAVARAKPATRTQPRAADVRVGLNTAQGPQSSRAVADPNQQLRVHVLPLSDTLPSSRATPPQGFASCLRGSLLCRRLRNRASWLNAALSASAAIHDKFCYG